MEDLVIHKVFAQIADRFPSKIAFQIKEDSNWRRLSYRQVETSAQRVAAFLIKKGYKKGDYAALILENCPEWGIVYLGIMYAGLACVAIDCELSSGELDNIFQDCQARVVFTSHSIFKDKIEDVVRSRLQVVIVDSEEFQRISLHEKIDVTWPKVDSTDVASLIYTSGTTARPKGVLLTHYNFCSNFRSIDKLSICSPKDNFLSILPLYHTYAFMVTLLVPLLSGAMVTYTRSFRPDDLTNIIKESNITILTGVPQMFSLIYKAIFEKIKKIPSFFRPFLMPLIRSRVRRSFGRDLRFCVSGGARLAPEIGRGLFKLGLKVIEGYGLTETSPVATLNPVKKVKFGSAGRVLPEVQIRILKPDKSGIGEVLIKGPNVMSGYFKQPDLTTQVKTSDGWFNSQDLGYLDRDGYLFLTGRKKDVIVLSSGKNIYPEELEEYYNHSPYIKEICIFQRSEERFGQMRQLLFAVIVPDFEYFRKKECINIRERIRWELENLSCRLPSYKRIMGFVIRKEDFPRTHLRKIKRYEIIKEYTDDIIQVTSEQPVFSPEDREILDLDITKRIMGFLSAQLNKDVQLSSHLELDLGIDSLGRVELSLGLESALAMKIPQGVIERALTVRDLIRNIRQVTINRDSKILVSQELFRHKDWSQILSESPPEGVLKKIRIDINFFDRVLIYIFKSILESIFRLCWFLRVEGKESIPLNGPYILCSNHASYLDGFIIFSSIPFKCSANLFFIGHAKIFEHPLVSWTVKSAHLISIDPLTHLTEALQAARFVIKHKKIICVFPEGSRSIDGKVQEFKKGVGILAKELDIPLVPVYIKNSHRGWPRGRRFPRPYPLRLIFGKPLYWRELGSDYSSIVRRLRDEVLKLGRK